MKVSLKFNRNLLLKIISAALFIYIANNIYADSTHIVEKGETLYAISRKYQITVGELRAANNMSESDVLKAGQKLVIPSADITAAAALAASPTPVEKSSQPKVNDTYIVQKGDTFYGIAKKYSISLSELFALNGLGNDAVLKAGQKLVVPGTQSEKSQVIAKAGQVKKSETVSSSEKSDKNNSNNQASGMDLKSADPRKTAEATAVDAQLVWPVKNPKVSYVKGKVSGVQLSAKKDEAVSAIRAGTIMYCGVYRGFGQVVFVQSKTGLIYAYTGLGSIEIQKGDYVVAGTEIGTVGVDSISKQPQMTLMVFQNGMPIDPAKAPRG